MHPPLSNIEAEQALLGALLVNNSAHRRVAEFLEAVHFAEAVHGRIYAAIARLIDSGQTANPVTLKNLFDQDGALREIGGAQYLVRLAASVVTVVNADDYGRSIRDLYLQRELVAFGEQVVVDAGQHDLDRPASVKIEAAERLLFALSDAKAEARGLRPFRHAIEEAENLAEQAFKHGRALGVPTGFVDLDKLIGGLNRSDLVVLAGRPSMGKTSLAMNVVKSAAASGALVALFLLEMSGGQIATRMISGESAVNSSAIRSGAVTHEQIRHFLDTAQTLKKLPIFIDDTSALSIERLHARARQQKRRQGLDLVVVDYLQLLEVDSAERKREGRVQAVSAIAAGLKTVARELDVPVLALSQLSRAVESRDDKRPSLPDLRDSGAIEQDADVVMFVYREEYYLTRSEPAQRADESQEKFNGRHERWEQQVATAANLAEVLIEKNRHGPIGKVTLRFDPSRTLFENFVGGDRLPGGWA